jgi:hypothetical protein
MMTGKDSVLAAQTVGVGTTSNQYIYNNTTEKKRRQGDTH